METTKSLRTGLMAESQMVLIVARWILIVLGLVLTLADTQSVSFMVTRFEVMVILMLAVSNFYLVSQVLTKRPAIDLVIYGAGLFDIAVITAIVIAQGGFKSDAYTFYFPALLAFSLTFPIVELYILLGGMLGAYGLIGLLSLNEFADFQVLVLRLMMFAAVAVCGNYFASLERKRQQAVLQNEPLPVGPEIGVPQVPAR